MSSEVELTCTSASEGQEKGGEAGGAKRGGGAGRGKRREKEGRREKAGRRQRIGSGRERIRGGEEGRGGGEEGRGGGGKEEKRTWCYEWGKGVMTMKYFMCILYIMST